MDGKPKSTSAAKMIKTTLYLPEELHWLAKIRAAEQRTTLTGLIIEGLKIQIEQKPKD